MRIREIIYLFIYLYFVECLKDEHSSNAKVTAEHQMNSLVPHKTLSQPKWLGQ